MSVTLALEPVERESALPSSQTLPARVPAWEGPAAVSPHILRRRARLVDRLFQWGVCLLTLLSGGAALYRLVWMGH